MTAKCFMASRVDIEPKWYLIDAEGRVLGRLATRIASILMGKNKPTYTAHVDTGDFVVVINAEKFAVTGRKMKDKLYFHNTKYPGGLREITLERLLAEKPTEALRFAVKRMLPKTKLGRQMYTKLKVYAGPDHPHAAQDPEPIKF
jgi:large subunit ribosomal protein L13